RGAAGRLRFLDRVHVRGRRSIKNRSLTAGSRLALKPPVIFPESAVSIHVALNHVTHYTYDRLINLGPQIIRLRPCPHSRTRILSYSLKIGPEQHFINWQQDPQGNYLARLVFPEKTEKFEIVVDLVADMSVINPFGFFLEPEAETWPFTYDPGLAEEIAPFRKLEPPGPLLKAWLDK